MKNKFKSILASIGADAYERQEAIALSLLSAMAGESIFLLGLPGVGKSMIARRLKLAFKDAVVFEYLMSRFSTPDEIFGPVSISGLKDHDRYERITRGYLPEAEVVFLDEIWKAGPAIQNSLLTVLNEKIFLNGNREIRLPLKAVIAASNELPAEGEGLEALWDRFLVRYVVEPIKTRKNFCRLIEGHQAAEPVHFQPLSQQEYDDIRRKSRNTKLSRRIADLIFDMREKLTSQTAEDIENDDLNSLPEESPKGTLYVSDRRWKKATDILRTSACINGRDEVDYSDVLLLSHILWNIEDDIPRVNQVLAETLVASLFKEVMANYRSGLSSMANHDSRPFSADGRYYVIQCDDYPLRISKKDYSLLKNNPEEYFFGSETADGILLIRPQGQFTVKFLREGAIIINSYTYPLQTTGDSETRRRISENLELSSDAIIRQLQRQIDDNIFIAGPPVLQAVFTVAKMYRERFSRL